MNVGVLIKLMKGNPSWNIACIGKQQPRFYFSCSSEVMKDATQWRPLAHERIFFNVNNIQSMIVHNVVVRGDILQPPNRH